MQMNDRTWIGDSGFGYIHEYKSNSVKNFQIIGVEVLCSVAGFWNKGIRDCPQLIVRFGIGAYIMFWELRFRLFIKECSVRATL